MWLGSALAMLRFPLLCPASPVAAVGGGQEQEAGPFPENTTRLFAVPFCTSAASACPRFRKRAVGSLLP